MSLYIYNPTITIVTVVFNNFKQIERTILSVLNQTYPFVEYIVIDGGSTDGTVDTIKKYSARISIWESTLDLGIFDAMNKGLKHASGDWINFMNSGDEFSSPDVLSNIVLKNISNSYVLWSNTLYKTCDGIYTFDCVPFFKSKGMYKSMGINHQSILVRTAVARKNMFDLTFKIAADYNMIKKIYDLGYSFMYIEFPISLVESDGYSTANKSLQRKEVARIIGLDNSIKMLLWIYYAGSKDYFRSLLKRITLFAAPAIYSKIKRSKLRKITL